MLILRKVIICVGLRKDFLRFIVKTMERWRTIKSWECLIASSFVEPTEENRPGIWALEWVSFLERLQRVSVISWIFWGTNTGQMGELWTDNFPCQTKRRNFCDDSWTGTERYASFRSIFVIKSPAKSNVLCNFGFSPGNARLQWTCLGNSDLLLDAEVHPFLGTRNRRL